MFREFSLEDLITFCDDATTVYSQYSFKGRAVPYKPELREIAEYLQQFPEDIWSKRIERDQLDLYTNDRTIYDGIVKQFGHKLLHRFEPVTGVEDLLDDTQTILVKKLPHNRYNYRVYLQPHKMANDKEGKKKYTDWLKVQERITCTPAIENWFYKTDWNWDRRYVLVEDEKTLLMLKLRNSEVVGKVYKFVVSDK